MSAKKKHPLPPRTLRMDRHGRIQSARAWLAAQRGRPAERIAGSYRKRYGVDWVCAIAELSTLGIVFDAKWREQLSRRLNESRRAKARRGACKAAAVDRDAFSAEDETFAFIAGCTEGGAPFGVTWEEVARLEQCASGDSPCSTVIFPP